MRSASTDKRGRPSLAPEMKKSETISVRAREAVRDRLADRAKKNGRSLSEEAEFRLLQSLELEPDIGPEAPLSVRLADAASFLVGGKPGTRRHAARMAVEEAIRALEDMAGNAPCAVELLRSQSSQSPDASVLRRRGKVARDQRSIEESFFKPLSHWRKSMSRYHASAAQKAVTQHPDLARIALEGDPLPLLDVACSYVDEAFVSRTEVMKHLVWLLQPEAFENA